MCECVKFSNITAIIVVSIGINFIQVYSQTFIVVSLAACRFIRGGTGVRVELPDHYLIRIKWLRHGAVTIAPQRRKDVAITAQAKPSR